MGNGENVYSLNDKKEKKDGLRKKALGTTKDITDKYTQSSKEDIVKSAIDLAKDIPKTIRYGMKKRKETTIHMYNKAEDRSERDDIRKGELIKSYCHYGLIGLGIICGTAITINWVNKNDSKLS